MYGTTEELDYYQQVELDGNDDFVGLPLLPDYDDEALKQAAERDEKQAELITARRKAREAL